MTALKWSDIDLDAGLVRVRAAFSDRRAPGSKITLGPLKSRAGRRTVGIPAAIVPVLLEHLAVFAAPERSALVFAGETGAPLRRSNFNRMSGWKHAAEAIGADPPLAAPARRPGTREGMTAASGTAAPRDPTMGRT